MADQMRAVDIRGGKGDRTALFINDATARPVPREGQALVRIKAFGINRMDIAQRQGLYPLPPQAPTTMGVEFSGVIEGFGAGTSADGTCGLRAGDEVLGLAYGGAYAEYIAASCALLMRKPAFLSHELAAAIPENWMTATQVLHLVLGDGAGGAGAGAIRGKTILWHAGASGVSSAGIQLALAAGASAVYATAGSQDKLDFITSRLGATAAFNYKTQDWVAGVQAATGGRGVDCIVDFVGADYFQKNLEAAARDGRIAILGTMSGKIAPQVDVGLVLYKRLRVQGSTLRSRDEGYQAELVRRLSEYVPDFESGKLTIYLDSVFPWEKIQEAHGHMEDAKNSGKIVCTIS